MQFLGAQFLTIFLLNIAYANEDHDKNVVQYKSPMIYDDSIYFSEHFDNLEEFNKRWIKSNGQKDQADGNIVKYDGQWELEQSLNNPLPFDLGLVLKSKAKHAAISAKLSRPYNFDKSDFVVQYEVTFQDGQECGGAYLKLLSVDKTMAELSTFHDKTPYTIMFGPDKCGNDHKLHFIFQHKNPKNGSMEEKHCKKPNTKLDEFFSDMKPHIYKLVLKPDNTFNIYVDHDVVQTGSLLKHFTPQVNPPAEIDDPNDLKPEDWDDREKIPDPTAKKPEDWDEELPEKISDTKITKPEGWLDEEPVDIRDPTAEKPEDWDEDMDGEWEAPLIPNPACQDVPGCGPWSPPLVANPEYKGKWVAPLIDNPNYRGKWAPRRIPNPNYFEDKNPFQMSPIAAVGFELWSMSPNILFDNIIITSDEAIADKWAAHTFDLKKQYFEGNEESIINRILNLTNENPWLWAVYVIVLLITTILLVLFCFGTTAKDKDQVMSAGNRKKTDEPEPDDEITRDSNDTENIDSGKPKTDLEQDEGEYLGTDGDTELLLDSSSAKEKELQLTIRKTPQRESPSNSAEESPKNLESQSSEDLTTLPEKVSSPEGSTEVFSVIDSTTVASSHSEVGISSSTPSTEGVSSTSAEFSATNDKLSDKLLHHHKVRAD